MTAKSVLMHSQGLCPGVRASTCPTPCHATVYKISASAVSKFQMIHWSSQCK